MTKRPKNRIDSNILVLAFASQFIIVENLLSTHTALQIFRFHLFSEAVTVVI